MRFGIKLASSVIFIYLAQTICAKYIFKALLVVTGTTGGYTIFALALLALLLSLGVLLSLYYIMRRYTPCILSFVTGRK